MSQRAILIAGMHRSGTSAYARVLNLLGADLGPADRMVKPRHDNPEGFWEHADLMRLNYQILEKYGQSWSRPKWWPDDWLKQRGIDEYARKIEQLLDRDFMKSPLWAFKDPRLCLTLDLWKQVLAKRNTDCAVFIPVRHPLEVASSLSIRDGMPIESGLAFWLMHNLKASRSALGMKGLILDYERLMSDPKGTVTRAADFLGISRDSWELSEALASLRPQLRHNRVAPDEAMPELVRKLWELLKSRDGDMLEPEDRKVLDEIRDEFISRIDLSVTRDLSWMTEFDSEDAGHAGMTRRLAITVTGEMDRAGSVRVYPSHSTGILFMKNPTVFWNGEDGLQRKPAEIMETKELVVLDREKGIFVSTGKNAEIEYSLLKPKKQTGRMRMAFDFSFLPMPLPACDFFAEMTKSKIWRFSEFLRDIKRRVWEWWGE